MTHLPAPASRWLADAARSPALPGRRHALRAGQGATPPARSARSAHQAPRSLVQNLDVRRDFQQLFDHVFVDEFQDTDPLQAEIVLYLCEREPRRAATGRTWSSSDGKLTIVGDPKQSIYRFRRADVAMYDRVRRVVSRQDHSGQSLSRQISGVSPTLIDWLNDRFARILGTSPDGRPFDPASGRVFQQPLDGGTRGGRRRRRCMSCRSTSATAAGTASTNIARSKAGRSRGTSAGSSSRATCEIVDPLDGEPRRVRYGDIAVLAISTWRLSLLFRQLDEEGIPYASRGGRLFLEDGSPAVPARPSRDRRSRRRSGDGRAAAAAVLRPGPARSGARAGAFGARCHGARRVGGGRLRSARRASRVAHATCPGSCAAAGSIAHRARRRAICSIGPRSAARSPLGPNGTQRLARLRELCLVLDMLAAAEGLDYDAVTARMRDWVADPVPLDPPHPVDARPCRSSRSIRPRALSFRSSRFGTARASGRIASSRRPGACQNDGSRLDDRSRSVRLGRASRSGTSRRPRSSTWKMSGGVRVRRRDTRA